MDPDRLPENVQEPLRRLLDGLERISKGDAPGTDLHEELDEAVARAGRQESTWATKTTVPMAVRANITRLRKQRDWTQQQLADAMDEAGFGWKRGTVAHVETFDPDVGQVRRQVSVDELLGLTRVFDVGLVDLLTPRSETTVVKLGTASLTRDDLRDLISRTAEGK